MTTQSLQHFIQVYENGSLSEAAKKNFITPQGMSKAIRQIEQEFDVALFTRQGNKLMATPEGHLMYTRAVQMINILKDLNQSFTKSNQREKVLGMVLSQSVSSVFSPSILAGIQEKNIKLKEISDDHDIYKYLKSQYDFGIFSGDCRQFDDFHKKKLQSGEIMMIIPEGHPYYGKKAISLDALRGKKLVLHAFGNKDKHIFLEKCLENGFVPDIIQEVIHFQSGIDLCHRHHYMMVTINFILEAQDICPTERVELYPRIPHNIYFVANPKRVSKQYFETIGTQMKQLHRQTIRV